jgi:ABC-type multidrug transport system fused ATPase/permease subunit
VGVVGHTGAGKTTIISLLLRLYDPTEGKIFLDGRDLRSYPRRELRSVFGMVQQDVFLFSGSIEENLTLWRPNGSDRLKEWSHLVPQSRDLILDERGGNLSAGERQVLAFGRAICADPKIWILDEATASVDSTLEASISVALKKASAGRTSILIAHRLATVRNADMILVLHQGELREKGKHEELMAAQGIYQRLYRYQSSMERTNQVSAH